MQVNGYVNLIISKVRKSMGHKRLVETNQSVTYPDFLKKAAAEQTVRSGGQPVLINMADENAERDLEVLIEKEQPEEIVDNYAEQYAELMLSKHAHLYRANHEVQVESIKELLKKHYGRKP